jgi:hypothetical protein
MGSFHAVLSRFELLRTISSRVRAKFVRFSVISGHFNPFLAVSELLWAISEAVSELFWAVTSCRQFKNVNSLEM